MDCCDSLEIRIGRNVNSHVTRINNSGFWVKMALEIAEKEARGGKEAEEKVVVVVCGGLWLF